MNRRVLALLRDKDSPLAGGHLVDHLGFSQKRGDDRP